MGRTKEFEDKEALQGAMHLFWEKGYDNTSLKSLLDAMNILNGSFYNSFGNKRAVFLETLKNYEDDFFQKFNQLFESKVSFSKKIHFFFNYIFDRQMNSNCPNGCFLANSMNPQILEDKEIKDFFSNFIQTSEGTLKKELKKAVKIGEIGDGVDPNATAAVLNAYLQGLMKLSLVEYKDAKIRKQTQYFLTSLGL